MQPSTPNCQQVLKKSLFEAGRSRRMLEQGVRVALCAPEGRDIVGYAEGLLLDRGLACKEDLRNLDGVPRGRWIVHCEKHGGGGLATVRDPLVSAAILGLCGPSFFCPRRPLVWTRERLSRVVSLHRAGDFYEH